MSWMLELCEVEWRIEVILAWGWSWSFLLLPRLVRLTACVVLPYLASREFSKVWFVRCNCKCKAELEIRLLSSLRLVVPEMVAWPSRPVTSQASFLPHHSIPRPGGAIIDLAWCITPELVPFPIGQTFSFVVPRRCRKVQQGGMRSGSVVLALECNCIPWMISIVTWSLATCYGYIKAIESWPDQ